MAEATDREVRNADGWNEPTKNLPPMEVRDLPEPLPLGKIIGASVILLATALGSGELLIWPYITTQAGVGLLWLATVGFLSQYFLNMEIERYTLATGETAVTGFSRFWKPWGIITVSPVVYNTIERVEMVLVVIIVAFLLLAIIIATDLSAWTGIVTEAPEGTTVA